VVVEPGITVGAGVVNRPGKQEKAGSNGNPENN